MKNGENYKRRTFLKAIGLSVIAISVMPVFQYCKDKTVGFLVRLTKTNHILGHRLWAKDFPKPTERIEIPYLIVGAGISGLSAARQFSKKGISDFLLLEMENHVGGNSSNGENRYSKFPLGAHYLPLPNFHDKPLLQFLEEEKIIVGNDENGLPVFDELQLTFAPHERLFYKNSWQEGLVPKTGNSDKENSEFDSFFQKMDFFRKAKDASGNYFFDIPLVLSSKEKSVTDLDRLTMKEWLSQNDFSAESLLQYVDYCCRDDFGLGIEFVSAWAGIHYFAGRKHDSVSNDEDNVLTWPEGNARLASHLKKYSESKTLKNHIAFDIKINNGKVTVKAFDDQNKKSVEIVCDKAIMATPQFVNHYLLENRKQMTKEFHYAPWVLATLTLSDLSDNFSFPLCWDNVIHGSKGLGYIFDQHQSVGQLQPKKVITYYHCFSAKDLKSERKKMYANKEDYFKKLVFDDLKVAHPDIENATEEVTIHLLGHGMISPVTGFIFGDAKQRASQPIDNKIFFAHSDLAGISIFEEAFHQGINAVNQIIK